MPLRLTALAAALMLAGSALAVDRIKVGFVSTLSGPGAGQSGSLLELTQGGKQAIRLSNGETRSFLEDGDTVILRGTCQRNVFRRIGLGECRGTVLGASNGR